VTIRALAVWGPDLPTVDNHVKQECRGGGDRTVFLTSRESEPEVDVLSTFKRLAPQL